MSKKNKATNAKLSRREIIDAIVEFIKTDIALLQDRVGSESSKKKILGLEKAIGSIEKLRAVSYSQNSRIAAGAIVTVSEDGAPSDVFVYADDLDLYGGYNPDRQSLPVSLVHLKYFKQFGVSKVGDTYKVSIGREDFGSQKKMCKIVGIR